MFKRFVVFLYTAVFVFSPTLQVHAGTTGGIQGRIVDRATGAPIADVTVSVNSPSQTATQTTDANGGYRFLSLAPDTYDISLSRSGYDPLAQSGINIFADQTQTIDLAMNKTVREIGRVTSRASSDFVKPGTTSDVYSVNAAGAEAAQALGGSGGLNSAYSAIASVPGASVAQGQQGWYQTVSIRGGDIDQVGYELDGIPVNRAYDNAPQTMLSSLGQQELQVYTGGTPASADASGIAGYINQVIKTGTYPGFGTVVAAVGSPTFYHKLSVEAGGSTPNRNFSYYVGLSGANQDYRYLDNNNGSGDPRFFYPFDVGSTPNGGFYGQWDGGPGAVAIFSPGNAYAIANTQQRDDVANIHISLPHRHDSLKDDIQLLWLTSEINAAYYSSLNDVTSPSIITADPEQGGLPNYQDYYIYTGQQFAAYNPASLRQYYFPSTSLNRVFKGTPIPLNQRDTNDNGVAVFKGQYQRNFNSSSYARLYAYTLYSNWFIYGPVSQALDYAAEIGDYEIPNHTFGANLSYANQVNERNLLSASVSRTSTVLQRLNTTGTPGFAINPRLITNYVNPTTGNCYDYTTGLQASCFYSSSNPNTRGNANNPNPTPVVAVPGAQWIVTDSGYTGNLNQVHPTFTAASLTDLYRPNDKTTINAGLRVENYSFSLGSTLSGPSRDFWFMEYNKEFCVAPFAPAPVNRFSNGGVCPAGYSAANLQNQSGGSVSSTVFQPRLGVTYQLSPFTVLRGSFGVYARPENSSWLQYNTVQQDLPSFLGQNFSAFGFNTPSHSIRPDVSYNYDLSLERQVRGTDLSFKVTPFYRSTRDQLQNFFINPANGLESGLNVGTQRSYGVEFALRKGDFSRDGFSGQLSYTYTNSKIKYHNFPGTNTNIIDLLNNYIQEYNSYTQSCAGAANATALCGNGNYAGHAAALLPSGPTPGLSIPNPYYAQAAQPLFDRNGEFTTYDVVPAPFAAGNGYETPHVLSLILNYKAHKFNISPSFTYSSGASYGSPLSWPGYVPETCGALAAGVPATANTATCTNGFGSAGTSFFIPDVYTGKFDALGAFKEPSRFTANLNLGFEFSERVKGSLVLTSLIDTCNQRGYAWDDSNVCVYGSLPSGILSPTGNFAPNLKAAPIQLQYPYSYWSNINNTGFVGVKLPLQAVLSVRIKI